MNTVLQIRRFVA